MSGACYEGGLLGKPAGAPGLAEYFSDVDGVCVKDSSYVPYPDTTCREIDALARGFSLSRCARETVAGRLRMRVCTFRKNREIRKTPGSPHHVFPPTGR